tara:strand:- start:475 stop:885 length:411 start_codon:yes stop_codon:yes gene_type:complete
LEIRQLLIKIFEYDVTRFLIVGVTSVLIDLIFYLILIYFSFDIALSKGVSFSIGALFSYFANKSYTFQTSKSGFLRFIFFSLLYVTTLIVNVMVNEILLSFLSFFNYVLLLAFLIATIISATLNFIGMKYFIFSSK